MLCSQTEELVPGGQNLSVTKSLRDEYIRKMADYKLNKQVSYLLGYLTLHTLIM